MLLFRLPRHHLTSLGLLSYNATAGMTLQLLCMLHTCANFGDLPATSQPRDLVARPYWVAHFWAFLHTLPLHDSHLNIRFLNVELQANWHGIKPIKWLIKFNLTISINIKNEDKLIKDIIMLGIDQKQKFIVLASLKTKKTEGKKKKKKVECTIHIWSIKI